MQVLFLLCCLLVSLVFAPHSTHTRSIEITEKPKFLQCSRSFLSWPLKRRWHANPFFNVFHAPLKNDSSLVSYTNENLFKMGTDCSISLKTGKTSCRRPKMPPKRFPGASTMPPNRFQDASKPQEKRQDGLRSLKDIGKTLHNASQTPQQACKWHPRRLYDDPKRVQNTLASSENQLCREVDSSDTNDKG